MGRHSRKTDSLKELTLVDELEKMKTQTRIVLASCWAGVGVVMANGLS